ncbi:P-loop containing nucleoside triphosphate hydrolase protein [Jimgerdemannia flammicorona]|uniref:P-loop containing nucleoside triphosphate hydrolase protein n=1 Tax=Jimgerdemannia flammicorona TaxID=994334 RepID=A0A433DM58_9FUNG|nr:P-loop containing nucleoside triphosphate hydrolase protein [Jimgerdemannia flammicorona]
MSYSEGHLMRTDYQQVLYMYALTYDLEILEHGDQTEISKKGITLSRGQKQCLALAHAVYSQANIIILDDCLSAIDAHTAKHLYEHCLMGCLMHDHTRILIMHHIRLCLCGTAHVVAMCDGEVVGSESPVDILQSDMLRDEVILEEKEGEAIEGKVPVLPVTVFKMHKEGLGKLVTDEMHAEGSVSREIYALYFNTTGGVWF